MWFSNGDYIPFRLLRGTLTVLETVTYILVVNCLILYEFVR